jgi:molybdopterin/thiamine biosynthesis adenylyltransferase
LTKKQQERYSRQLVLDQIGNEGQRLLGSGSVLVLGLGGLGSTVSTLLVRAGVGRLVLVDDGKVELSNLPRQVLYNESDIGRTKTQAARSHLKKIGAGTDLVSKHLRIDGYNLEGLLDGIDVIIDGTDNMATRRIINEACVKHATPWVFGGVEGTRGMSMTIIPKKTPCLTCLFPEGAGTKTKARTKVLGVMNTLPFLIGAIQATEAKKLLLGKFPRPGLLVLDPWTWESRVLDVKVRKGCPTCQRRLFPHLRK